MTGECLEVSLQKNLNCLQLASISLLRPLHSLPQGSGFSAFLRRTNDHLQHLNSDLTSLSSGFSLSVCPSSSLTFFSEASASWLHSKYCFDQQQGNPFIAKWNPNLESTGRYFHKQNSFADLHMGQFLQGGKNGCFVSLFFFYGEPSCGQTMQNKIDFSIDFG